MEGWQRNILLIAGVIIFNMLFYSLALIAVQAVICMVIAIVGTVMGY